MRIKSVRAVRVAPSAPADPATPPRRPSWHETTVRGTRMSPYRYHNPSPAAVRAPRDPVWARVEAEDGTWGLGLTGFGDPVAKVIDGHLAPLLMGQDCFATRMASDVMWRATAAYGSVGLAACAISAVDLALWDLVGKLQEQPVYRLLGGPSHAAVKCYATSDDLDWSRELGFTAFKISNSWAPTDGDRGLREMEARVANARNFVGPDATLGFNPVQSFDVDYAVQVCERLRPYNLAWIEQPLPTEDLEGHIELRRRAPSTRLATGENHQGLAAFRQLIEHRVVDILQPDILWVGGLTTTVKVCAMAEAAGIAVSLHVGANNPFGLHCAYALPSVTDAEFWLGSAPGVPIAEANRIPGHSLPENGLAIPPDRPGFGLEIEPASITPYFDQ
ncbi:MAG: enolase C-terminal domain-like protein [Chloroflexota bacterium]|jgi:L-rhamnonate dehydratase|nr:enolase C-terminal domain-like protein [Chloroflexota bacterium]MDP6507797.1 enolase C-terminal domain-like protein [Chloroflexota bacterium]